MPIQPPPIATETLPWMPLGEGVAARILRLAAQERSLQLRVEPGTVIPRHRHDGPVHAFNVSGSRMLADGTIAGPGAFVYEPAGNEDWWGCHGDEPCVVQISMRGRLTYLNADGSDGDYVDTAKISRQYLAWCTVNGYEPVAIGSADPQEA